MTLHDDLRRNTLLGCLPEDELAWLRAEVTVVRTTRYKRVHEASSQLEDIYFPLDAVFSVVEVVDGTGMVEVTTIGNEGVVGVVAFMEAVAPVNTTFCQVPGRSARVGVGALRRAMSRHSSLLLLFQRYAQVTILRLSRNVACNQVHLTRQRASRWLLSMSDQVGGRRFPLTHEFLAQMLGVRRATVSEIAASLRDDGLIRYRYGQVEILDHAGLERAACECYRVVRDRSDELLRQGIVEAQRIAG